MRYSELITKTSKNLSTEIESINARLLIRAGFIHQEIAGVYTFLPLGLRVLNKVEGIVRQEMNKIGSELLMPALQDKHAWQQTGRLESVDVLFKAIGANKLSVERGSAEYILGSTHEEVVTPLAQHYRSSYKDLPFALYQIQTKFRNEPRAKSGLLRGREFRMKDLYSFHASQADLENYYERAKKAYTAVFARLGLGQETFLTYASGGDFTKEYSHEFQTLLPSGEDTIYLDRKKSVAYNAEIATASNAKKLGVDFKKLEVARASEVGNIFPLGTKFSNAFNYLFTDKDNRQKPVLMGCYGIGTSRLVGVIAEKFADAAGLVWPESVAPFDVHVVVLGEEAKKHAQKLHDELSKTGLEVLLDDRHESAGTKLADADLIGVPIRVVVSDKTLIEASAEVKIRTETNTKLVKLNKLVTTLAN